jgi:hypothetical protein
MMTDFPQPVDRVRTEIGDIDIQLHDPDGSVNNRSISGNAAVLDQFGEMMRDPSWSGDLLPFLDQADIAWLLDFQDRMRIKAQSLLPTP